MKCQCHELYYDRCGREADTIVEVMPNHLRNVHRISQDWGVYPHNGAERLHVSYDCAEAIIEGDEDGYAHEVD